MSHNIGRQDRGETAGLAHSASPAANRRPESRSSRWSRRRSSMTPGTTTGLMARSRATTSRAVVEPSRMSVAGGEKAIWRREIRVVLYREEKLRYRLVEAPTERNSAPPITIETQPDRARGLRRSETSTCSIAISGWPAHQPSTPLMCQPRAKLGLSASARSTRRHHGTDVLAEIGQRNRGIARIPGSSPATSSARRARSAPSRRSASGLRCSRLDSAEAGKPRPRRARAHNADRARSPLEKAERLGDLLSPTTATIA